MTPRSLPARLLWVVDREALDRGVVPAALRGGVCWLYLRDPTLAVAEWRIALDAWARGGLSTEAVVNGAPDWARKAGLGGHLKAAQPALDPSDREGWPWLGRSIHGAAGVRQALVDRPDYLVAGPVFPTAAKPGHPGIGLEGLSAIVGAAGECPVLAVGGVDPDRVAAVVASGAAGVTVRSGITAAGDPEARARAYAAALERAALPVDPR